MLETLHRMSDQSLSYNEAESISLTNYRKCLKKAPGCSTLAGGGSCVMLPTRCRVLQGIFARELFSSSAHEHNGTAGGKELWRFRRSCRWSLDHPQTAILC